MDPDDREFMRELLRRHEKALDAMLARFNAVTAELREHTREMREDHREFIEEVRAQRSALLRILDRLDGGAAGA